MSELELKNVRIRTNQEIQHSRELLAKETSKKKRARSISSSSSDSYSSESRSRSPPAPRKRCSRSPPRKSRSRTPPIKRCSPPPQQRKTSPLPHRSRSRARTPPPPSRQQRSVSPSRRPSPQRPYRQERFSSPPRKYQRMDNNMSSTQCFQQHQQPYNDNNHVRRGMDSYRGVTENTQYREEQRRPKQHYQKDNRSSKRMFYFLSYLQLSMTN